MNNEMAHEDGKDAEVDAECLLATALSLHGAALSPYALTHIKTVHLLLEKMIDKQEKEIER